jgi:hypothetical protein
MKVSFTADLNNRTRSLIQSFDKIYRQNIEHRIDTTIQESPLADFCSDKAEISFVETENPHCNIAPVITLDINGVSVSHVLNSGSKICTEQDEEFLFEKLNRRPYRYINTISNRINSESISEIKKGLAIDYYTKIGKAEEIDNIDESTFDKLFDSQI